MIILDGVVVHIKNTGGNRSVELFKKSDFSLLVEALRIPEKSPFADPLILWLRETSTQFEVGERVQLEIMGEAVKLTLTIQKTYSRVRMTPQSKPIFTAVVASSVMKGASHKLYSLIQEKGLRELPYFIELDHGPTASNSPK